MSDDNFELGRYGFERIDRTKLQMWAEGVRDDEELSVDDKAFALKLVGEFSDSDEGEHVTEEFCEPMSADDSVRRVSVGRLIDCGHIRVLWTRQAERRTLFGIVLGQEVYNPESGEAA